MLNSDSQAATLSADHLGSFMSISAAQTFLRNAKEQFTQRDINESLMRAIGELTSEVKRLEDELRRVRREVTRRF
jgi:hypothetical protein